MVPLTPALSPSDGARVCFSLMPQRTPGPQFEREACLHGISTEHLHGVERELVQVFANQIQLLQDALLQHSVQSSDRLAQIGELIPASPFSTHGVYNLTQRAQRARSWKVSLGKRSFG